MDVVTAVTVGLRVLVFLQELEKDKLQDNDKAIEAAQVLLEADESQAKEIMFLASQLDEGFLHNILQSVGGVLSLVDIFNKKGE